VISTQKWESVTREWLEQEIVESLVIAGKRRARSAALARLLAREPKTPATSPRLEGKRAQEHIDA
jgi:hypothetical protein